MKIASKLKWLPLYFSVESDKLIFQIGRFYYTRWSVSFTKEGIPMYLDDYLDDEETTKIKIKVKVTNNKEYPCKTVLEWWCKVQGEDYRWWLHNIDN